MSKGSQLYVAVFIQVPHRVITGSGGKGKSGASVLKRSMWDRAFLNIVLVFEIS